ncbi:MAG: hypothetical protein K6G00_07885 [Treponema sp.]|nr:hypothetical protein [Treponema sp.]
MKKINLKQGILFFYIFDGILLALFIISFLPFAKKNKVPSVPTALLNPKFESKVSNIVISSPSSSITLKKGNDFWIGTSSESNGKYIWPADIQTVSNFINSAKQIIKVNVKSKNVSSWESLSVDDEHATSITFYEENKAILSQIFFGLKDSLSLKLYFRTWTKSIVYEGISPLESFLTTEESFWADPFLYPQCITGYDRNYSEILLRRGLIQNIAPKDGLTVDFNLKKDFENGSIINFKIYKKDKEYIVIPYVNAGPAISEKDLAIISKINYRYSISAVTCEKLLEELR